MATESEPLAISSPYVPRGRARPRPRRDGDRAPGLDEAPALVSEPGVDHPMLGSLEPTGTYSLEARRSRGGPRARAASNSWWRRLAWSWRPPGWLRGRPLGWRPRGPRRPVGPPVDRLGMSTGGRQVALAVRQRSRGGRGEAQRSKVPRGPLQAARRCAQRRCGVLGQRVPGTGEAQHRARLRGMRRERVSARGFDALEEEPATRKPLYRYIALSIYRDRE